jgi:hypothetical protein
MLFRAGAPELYSLQDPARLGWKPVMTVEHYQLSPDSLLAAREKSE